MALVLLSVSAAARSAIESAAGSEAGAGWSVVEAALGGSTVFGFAWRGAPGALVLR